MLSPLYSATLRKRVSFKTKVKPALYEAECWIKEQRRSNKYIWLRHARNNVCVHMCTFPRAWIELRISAAMNLIVRSNRGENEGLRVQETKKMEDQQKP